MLRRSITANDGCGDHECQTCKSSLKNCVARIEAAAPDDQVQLQEQRSELPARTKNSPRKIRIDHPARRPVRSDEDPFQAAIRSVLVPEAGRLLRFGWLRRGFGAGWVQAPMESISDSMDTPCKLGQFSRGMHSTEEQAWCQEIRFQLNAAITSLGRLLDTTGLSYDPYSSGFTGNGSRGVVAVAGQGFLSRQVLRRGLFRIAVYAISSRVHMQATRRTMYHGLVHRAGALFDESEFTGDENAIVDFKYSASPRITWWFDHHLSAFLTPQDHEHFLACQRDPVCGMRKFFDPDLHLLHQFPGAHRCDKIWIQHEPVADLIHWANIVDGALYESPEAAVEMAAPAMKLTLIIESTQDPEFIPKLIPLLTEMPLAEVLAQPFVASLLPPLLERHKEAIELIRSRSEECDGTIFFDITDARWKGSTSSSPTICIPRRRIRSDCRNRVSGPRCPSARIRGPRLIPRRW